MKMIAYGKDTMKEGKDAKGALSDAGSVVYFVDETGSSAIVDGCLYIDGQLATKGTHRIALDDGDDVVVDVDAKGKSKHRVETGGVKANGKG